MDDFRIAQNFISKYTLNNTATYAYQNFPRQADMTTAFEWYDPIDFSDLYVEGAEFISAMDNTEKAVGGIEFSHTLFLPKAGMVEYIEQTLFGGVRRRKFTVQTKTRRSRSAPWITVWCWGALPDPREAEPLHEGFGKYKISFFDGILAALGNEFTYEFSYEFT